MFSVVVAIGSSLFGTPLYAAETEGTPMAPCPIPRSSNDAANTGPTTL
jgi:hypothetical protein